MKSIYASIFLSSTTQFCFQSLFIQFFVNPSDIQECLQLPSVCNDTQICEDIPPGSFTCSCPPGTIINEQGTCVGMCHI